MIKQFNANHARLRRHHRVRRKVEGSQERLRLSVFRSGQHIYAQVIDDVTGHTLASASSIEDSLRNFKPEPRAGQPKDTALEEAPVEVATEAAPIKGKGAKSEKAASAPKASAKAAQ